MGDIMRINDRKFAAMMGLLSATTNFGILATTIHASIFVAGLISLIITALLLSPVKLNKRVLLAMMFASVVVFTLSIIPKSFSALFVVPFPYSLLNLYLLETIKTPRINSHTAHVTD